MDKQTNNNLLRAVLEGSLRVKRGFNQKHHFCVIVTIVSIAVEALNRATLHSEKRDSKEMGVENRCE